MTLTYKKILVAVDGSEEADRAFRKALEIAKRNNAEIVVAHVIDTGHFVAMEAYELTAAGLNDSYAYELMDKFKEEAAAAGIENLITDVDKGSPKVRIPRQLAKKHEVDLIVCGATGLNAVERFLMGSVTEHITRHAPCDVLVVRSEK
ncbi:universal stress protein [Peribacillus sp. SCS-155]|uniref:universal stress protein n=1 Tax=Peribacillus sedimenti TaxID=3115297 RepID=UPI003905D0EF